MCLISDTINAEHAGKDITCYKLVYINKRDKRFRSIYERFIYTLGTCYSERRFEKQNHSMRVSYGFHSYHTIKEALLRSTPGGMVLLKCVIPADSWYYTSCDDREYCSDRIKVVAWKPLWHGKWKENFEK